MPAGTPHYETTMQFIARMQQATDLSERELQLLDRLVTALDELQVMESELRARDREFEDEVMPEAA